MKIPGEAAKAALYIVGGINIGVAVEIILFGQHALSPGVVEAVTDPLHVMWHLLLALALIAPALYFSLMER